MKKEPDIFYKYLKVDKRLYELLINNEIWYSKPSGFNDPYDCNIDVSKIKNIAELLSFVKTHNLNDIEKLIQKNEPIDQKKFKEIRKALQSIGKEAIKKFGIACFSSECDNILMWSHYANDHKGICLGFDPYRDSKNFRLAQEVQYEKDYPKIDLVKEDLFSQLIKIATYKHLDWKYENEFRIINFKNSGHRKFNVSSLREVIFGCKTSPKDIDTVINLLYKFGYEHVELKQARQYSTKFKLGIRKLGKRKIKSQNRYLEREMKEFVELETKVHVDRIAGEVSTNLLNSNFIHRYEELVRDFVYSIQDLDKKGRREYINKYLPLNSKFVIELMEEKDLL